MSGSGVAVIMYGVWEGASVGEGVAVNVVVGGIREAVGVDLGEQDVPRPMIRQEEIRIAN